MMFGSKVREKQNAEQYTADVQKINSISKAATHCCGMESEVRQQDVECVWIPGRIAKMRCAKVNPSNSTIFSAYSCYVLSVSVGLLSQFSFTQQLNWPVLHSLHIAVWTGQPTSAAAAALLSVYCIMPTSGHG